MEVRRFRVCGRPGGEIIQSAVDGAPLGYDSREAPRLLALGFARGPLCRTARIGSSGSGGFGSGGGSGSGPGIGGVGCGVGSGGGNGLRSGDMHAVCPAPPAVYFLDAFVRNARRDVILLIILAVLALFGGVGYYRR